MLTKEKIITHENREAPPVLFFFGMVFLFVVCAPVAFAQSYVPVNDADLISDFETYSENFDTFAESVNDALTGAEGAEDSLRDIIAGQNPGGVAIEDCKLEPSENNESLFPYEDPPGPWATAVASTSEFLESGVGAGSRLLEIPKTLDVNVNASGSLRCILQDLVGYQKISLFVQIQSLIKQYISDAQQKALAGQLLNQISATNLNWAQQGNIVNNFGVMVTESVYVQNSTQSTYNENGRIVNNLVNRAAAPDNDPTGSLELNDPLYVASQVAITMRDETENPQDSLAQETEATLTYDETNACMDDMNAEACPRGGAFFALGDIFKNIQNTPRGATAMVQAATQKSIEQNKERNLLRQTGNGVTATKRCSELESDPGCDPRFMTDDTPSGQNFRVITDAAAVGNEQIANSDMMDTLGDGVVARESTELNTEKGGLSGYNTTALQNSGTNVNLLIAEMYKTIETAYFDLNKDQKLWSQAALLMIYDEMNFSDSKPATQIGAGNEYNYGWENEEPPQP